MDVTRLRELSKELLGNKYRLEVVTAIVRSHGEPVFAQALADDSGVRYPRVQEELKRLAAAGMLKEQTDGLNGPAVLYKPIQSTYWDLCAKLHEELAGSPEA